MTRIAAVHKVLAPYRHPQRAVTDMVEASVPGENRALLDRLHASARVRSRCTVLPLDAYQQLSGFGAANDAYVAAAEKMAAQALDGALESAGLPPDAVDLLVFVSTTGVAAPSIDARLAGALGLRTDVTRLPLFGLGCAAGAAGIGRLHDYLRGQPGHTAALVSVELCSLTFQRDDTSMANLVGSALFGDGAAALVARGQEAPDPWPATGAASGTGRGTPGPTVVASRSRFYPDTERAMGWDVKDSGFRIVLDPGIPDIVRTHLAADIDAFLAGEGLTRGDIGTWVCHPGGPKVLEAITSTLELPDGALDVTWDSLAEVGNLSSASVLHVLEDTRRRGPRPGTLGLLLALGPGFCAELVLLRW
ncbi:type III polyketide synthase [Streptomyces iconiensis]|uniref:3-oxoacyl-[acyl-carrier-protein] synthase III C-terminal domain-containing protein n=1 Tax=Streptomyces iconiensis TaxID=1384038 RepID=A0ABT6ZV85_9ACTN|nr:3-oxoacyl-[acyl-carrier-protein] synthase III C-terminal domain-containing protein [Streptomyces iconiensis]MDJ1132976.1 3-oxoacyl-[acyl-carrier-protein] synthase III C-terminal domain-containing protein [Streptomyces iconiensis]